MEAAVKELKRAKIRKEELEVRERVFFVSFSAKRLTARLTRPVQVLAMREEMSAKKKGKKRKATAVTDDDDNDGDDSD